MKEAVNYSLVSVIVPTRRIETNLNHILCNFNKQTYKNKELIIVSDKYIDIDDKNVTLIQSDCLLSSALNLAIKNTSGEWIAKMDDDDVYSTNYLKRMQEEAVNSDADYLGIISCIVYFTGDKSIYLRGGKHSPRFNGATLFMTRKCAFEHGFKENLTSGEDVEFEIRGEKNGLKRHIVNDISLYVYVRHQDNTWEDSDDDIKKKLGLESLPELLGTLKNIV